MELQADYNGLLYDTPMLGLREPQVIHVQVSLFLQKIPKFLQKVVSNLGLRHK